MASLSNLSDDELRNKLKEHGITSPVTSATRTVLLKKLNNLTKSSPNLSRGKTSTRSTPTRVSPRTRKNSYNNISQGSEKLNLNAYSSDEDDYEDPTVNHSGYRRNIEKKSSKIETQSYKENKRSPVLRKRTGNSPSSLSATGYKRKVDDYQYDTGSDSDTADEVDCDITPEFEKSSTIGNDYSYKNEHLKSLTNNIMSPKASTLGLMSKRFNEDSILRDSVVTQERESNHTHLNGRGNNYSLSKFSVEECSDRDSYWSSVPILLLGLLALFFIVLGVCYVSIHYPVNPSLWLSYLKIFPNFVKQIASTGRSSKGSSNSLNLGQNKFPICKNDAEVDCVTHKELNSVVQILGGLEDRILPVLMDQASKYQCGEAAHLYLPLDEFSQLISREFPGVIPEEQQGKYLHLTALDKLLSHNRHWGLKAFHENDEDPAISRKLLGFGAVSYPTQILCRISQAFYSTLLGLSIAALGVALSWIMYALFRFYRNRSQKLEQESFELVEKILEILENSCGTVGKEYIAVNHVRDCLIPPRDRRVKASIWNKAVQFIDDHDSRVYRDVRSISGEDCEVWRWVSGAPRSPIACQNGGSSTAPVPAAETDQPPEKVWQGKAFEPFDGMQNLPPVSPTSCLKIRNMFDSEIEFGDNWPWRIQDSLLEKCEGVKILHVSVDRLSKEGCVYAKCASAFEAGRAFRALHGWWFDGNLVTVKYLREERYHERFPTAKIASIPLSPSNSRHLSLRTPSNSPSPNWSEGSSAPRLATRSSRRS